MKATVKIIDFGFAAKIEKSGLKYTTLGSPINMDPLILKELSKRGKKTRKLGYDQKADIWSLGTICYEMLIGKCVFNAEDLDELVDKVENGTYTVPTNLSKEVISFLNGMLQYDPNQRLNIEQLSNHTFLTKNVKSFEPIDIKKVKRKVDKSKLEINIKKNKSIWAIFNQEDEDKLVRISAQCFDKPIDEQANFVKPNLNNNNLNNNNNQNNNLNNRNNNQNNMQKMQSGNLNNRINNQNNIQKMQSDNLKNINQNNNKNNMQNNNNLNNRNNMQNQKPNHNHNQNNDNKNNTNNNNDRFLGKQAQPQNKQFVPAYPYTYAPGGLYQGVQGVPMQRVVGMPVMAYTPMQPIQGYAMPTTAYAYYK
jgi:serine/threonine protein kinase